MKSNVHLSGAAVAAFWLAGLGLAVPPLGALEVGDDLAASWKAAAPRLQGPRVLGALEAWPGWSTVIRSADLRGAQGPFYLTVEGPAGARAGVLGVVEGDSGNPRLVLDADGDGRADLVTKVNRLPGWGPLKIPGPRGDGKDFRALADRIYQQYNQTQGPSAALLEVQVAALRARALDPKNPDRDLDGTLVFYLDRAVDSPALAAGALEALASALKARGGVPPLVHLFRGEAQTALGQTAAAGARWADLAAADPATKIGAFKLGAFKKAQGNPGALEAFRKANPDYWALRAGT